MASSPLGPEGGVLRLPREREFSETRVGWGVIFICMVTSVSEVHPGHRGGAGVE